MGLCRANDGQAYLCELQGGQWVWYADYTLSVSWPRYLPEPYGNVVQSLASGTREYDYALQNGYDQFSVWVSLAAADAGR